MNERILNILFKFFIPNGYVYEGLIDFLGGESYTFNDPLTTSDPIRICSDLIQDLKVIHSGHMEKEFIDNVEKELIDMLTFYIVMQSTTFIESDNIKFYSI